MGQYDKIVQIFGNKLKNYICANNYTQNDIVKICERSGFKITQGTISNIINHKCNVSLSTLLRLYDILDIDIIKVIEEETFYPNSIGKYVEKLYEDTVFYKTKKDTRYYEEIYGVYNVYFYTTNRFDNSILEGKLEVSEEEDYSKAELIITFPDIKKFEGFFVLSDIQDAGYFVLFGQKTGEILFITFNYRCTSTGGKKMKFKMGVMATTSSSQSERYPTMERIFLVRDELNTEQREVIATQLKMHKSKIMISDEAYQKLASNNELSHEFLEIFGKYKETKHYHIIDEEFILKSGMPLKDCMDNINLLRKQSTAPKNFKVSPKAETNIFKVYFE